MNLKMRFCIYLVAAIAILSPCKAHAAIWAFTSVRSYGAYGDGTHDDTAAINSAITGGTVGDKMMIYFPPGIYKYTGSMTLPANTSCRLYGDGPGVSTILFTGPTLGINGWSMGQATLNVEGLTLEANTLNCGTAIRGVFGESSPAKKFRTATIHNVQIVGSTRTGLTGTYWTNGIYLYKAQNAVIDKVEISGNFHTAPDVDDDASLTGIVWESSSDYATTGLQLSSLEIKFVNTALKTGGWVEGLYLFAFEFAFCGQHGWPVVDLNTSDSVNLKPAFHLYNGHVESIENGIRATNIRGIKLSKLVVKHNNPAAKGAPPASLITFNNCTDAIVSQCSFVGRGHADPDEGILLNNAHSVQIAQNYFSQFGGSCIGIMSNSNTVHITNNVFGGIFGSVAQPYDDQNPDPNDPYFRGNYPPP